MIHHRYRNTDPISSSLTKKGKSRIKPVCRDFSTGMYGMAQASLFYIQKGSVMSIIHWQPGKDFRSLFGIPLVTDFNKILANFIFQSYW